MVEWIYDNVMISQISPIPKSPNFPPQGTSSSSDPSVEPKNGAAADLGVAASLGSGQVGWEATVPSVGRWVGENPMWVPPTAQWDHPSRHPWKVPTLQGWLFWYRQHVQNLDIQGICQTELQGIILLLSPKKFEFHVPFPLFPLRINSLRSKPRLLHPHP